MPPDNDTGQTVATDGTASTTATTGEQPSWYATMDAETIGHIQNRGWHEKTPAEAAALAVQSYRELEKFRGVPGDEIARIPKDASDAQGWLALRTRLGVPNDPSGYVFDGVTGADNQPVPADKVELARSIAADLNLPKDAAPALLRRLMKLETDASTASATDRTAKLAAERDALKQNWGANYDAHLAAADGAAEALGVTKEQLETLKGVVGGAKVADMFRNIATKIGEDKFINGGGSGANKDGLLTQEQAKASIADLKGDPEFVKKYLAGDVEANKRMSQLHVIAAGPLD